MKAFQSQVLISCMESTGLGRSSLISAPTNPSPNLQSPSFNSSHVNLRLAGSSPRAEEEEPVEASANPAALPRYPLLGFHQASSFVL
ncbi:hypothetical protein Pmani_016085 [Petrolisthes manimaculis]|uniref:Uncharacterized protein n=1 Tax=Petrolisthes manimaculis TaxID=1843537 RepID=A0AAE1PQ81_9EUCA|nr:hypothetical protein Pmani_016085 [Petrolisthes manimaculis]